MGASSGKAGHSPVVASTIVGEVLGAVAVLTGQGATCTGKMVAGKCAADDTSEVGVGPRTATHIPPALHQRHHNRGGTRLQAEGSTSACRTQEEH